MFVLFEEVLLSSYFCSLRSTYSFALLIWGFLKVHVCMIVLTISISRELVEGSTSEL
jgi:hypothetical protein